MSNQEQFRTTMFGGFDKEDVMNGISRLLKESEEKVRQQENVYQQKIIAIEKNIAELKKSFNQAILQVKTLKNELQTNENEYQQVIHQKNCILDENAMTIRQLELKTEELQRQLSRFHELDAKRDEKVHQAEQNAKERTEKIIVQAKQKVEDEYRKRLEQAQQEIQNMRKQARVEATRIIQNASERAKTVTAQTKKDTAHLIETAQAQRDDILVRANETAKKILAKASATVFEEQKESLSENEDIPTQTAIDFEKLQKEIEQEVAVALQHLDSAGLSVATAKDKIQDITVTSVSPDKDVTQYKQALYDYFKENPE